MQRIETSDATNPYTRLMQVNADVWGEMECGEGTSEARSPKLLRTVDPSAILNPRFSNYQRWIHTEYTGPAPGYRGLCTAFGQAR